MSLNYTESIPLVLDAWHQCKWLCLLREYIDIPEQVLAGMASPTF